jgi:hypothetical protein
VNPGYEDNFKVFKLQLENWPRRQEVDSLTEAIVEVELMTFIRVAILYDNIGLCFSFYHV